MVRLRLQRPTTESFCLTGVKPRITPGQQGIPVTAMERAGTDRAGAGRARDRAGIARDRPGIARNKWHNR